jgi:3-oxoadipate enol-lactonase
MAAMTINNEVFNVLVEGASEAPALVLSNSLGTNLHMWDAQIPALLERFRVVRYDSRGHGASGVGEGPYSMDQLGADVLAILDALAIEKAHFLGLSKGGMVGQWLLIHAPHRIDRAILANTAPQMSPPDMWNERIRTVRANGMAEIAPAVVDRWFTHNFQTRDPEAVEAIRNMLLETPAAGYAACCAAVRDMDLREKLRTITNPVLVIVGKHDLATPPEIGKFIADNIEGARLLALDAAHLSNIEAAEAFNEAVVSFLTEARMKAGRTRRAAAPRSRAARAGARGKPAAAQQPPGQAPARKVKAKAAAVKAAAANKRAAAPKSARKPAKLAAAGRAGSSRKATLQRAGKKRSNPTGAGQTSTSRTARTTGQRTASKKITSKRISGKKTSGKKPRGKQ